MEKLPQISMENMKLGKICVCSRVKKSYGQIRCLTVSNPAAIPPRTRWRRG